MSSIGKRYTPAVFKQHYDLLLKCCPAAGLALPVVGIPIREYFNTPTPKNPPAVKDVSSQASAFLFCIMFLQSTASITETCFLHAAHRQRQSTGVRPSRRQ